MLTWGRGLIGGLPASGAHPEAEGMSRGSRCTRTSSCGLMTGERRPRLTGDALWCTREVVASGRGGATLAGHQLQEMCGCISIRRTSLLPSGAHLSRQAPISPRPRQASRERAVGRAPVARVDASAGLLSASTGPTCRSSPGRVRSRPASRRARGRCRVCGTGSATAPVRTGHLRPLSGWSISMPVMNRPALLRLREEHEVAGGREGAAATTRGGRARRRGARPATSSAGSVARRISRCSDMGACLSVLLPTPAAVRDGGPVLPGCYRESTRRQLRVSYLPLRGSDMKLRSLPQARRSRRMSPRRSPGRGRDVDGPSPS